MPSGTTAAVSGLAFTPTAAALEAAIDFLAEHPGHGGAVDAATRREAFAAYEALPEEWKQRITGMQTACSLLSPARFKIANPDIVRDQQTAQVPPTIQPLVRTHPERGTKAIWFHKGKTEKVLGMEHPDTLTYL